MNRNKKYTKKRGSKKRKTQKVRKMKGSSLGKKCRVCGLSHKHGKMCPFEKNVSDSVAGGSKGKSCPICNVKHIMGRSMGVAGGSCGCGLPQGAIQQGGNFYKPAAPIPGPFVGQAWTPQVSGWPGVNGISSDRNYLADNLYPVDPQTMMQLDGGKRRVRGSRKSRGGGLIPQDLVNLGRNISFNIGSAYNAINGYTAPVNPLPYMDQFPNSTKLIM